MCLAVEMEGGTEKNIQMDVKPADNAIQLQTRAGPKISREQGRKKPREVTVAGMLMMAAANTHFLGEAAEVGSHESAQLLT